MSLPNERGANEKTGKPSVDELIATLFPPPPEDGSPALELYAILDGARDKKIFRAVYESGLDYACLFTGDLPTDLMEAAPYLVHLKKNSPFVRKLLDEGWGNSWGVFAWTRADLERMRRHCRKLLRVKDEQGNELFFRWYDPRVLRVYLPTCTEAELKEVCGPVGRWGVEGEEGNMLRFGSDQRTPFPETRRIGAPLDATKSIFMIHAEQMVALEKQREYVLVRLLADHFRTEHPDAVNGLSEEELERRIVDGITQARAHGLTLQSSLGTFVGLQLVVGADFHRHPPIHAILTDSSHPADARLAVLQQRLSPRDWWEARAARDLTPIS